MKSALPHIIQRHLNEIRQLCIEHHVRKLWAFGSVLDERFTKDSDIDFLYEWDDEAIPDEVYLDNLWALLDKLEGLLGHKIDWVYYPNLKNPYFIKEVEATKVLLYDGQSKKIPV